MRNITFPEQPMRVVLLLSEALGDMLEVTLNQLAVLSREKENPSHIDKPTMQCIIRRYAEQQIHIQGYQSLCEHWHKAKLNRRQKITLEKLETKITQLEKTTHQILGLCRDFLENALH